MSQLRSQGYARKRRFSKSTLSHTNHTHVHHRIHKECMETKGRVDEALNIQPTLISPLILKTAHLPNTAQQCPAQNKQVFPRGLADVRCCAAGGTVRLGPLFLLLSLLVTVLLLRVGCAKVARKLFFFLLLFLFLWSEQKGEDILDSNACPIMGIRRDETEMSRRSSVECDTSTQSRHRTHGSKGAVGNTLRLWAVTAATR